jgi:predicted thioredoxin/glutaredoxin
VSLEENTRTALSELSMNVQIEKITDFAEIAKYGVMSVPALVIDEKVVSVGRVLNPKEIAEIIGKMVK